MGYLVMTFQLPNLGASAPKPNPSGRVTVATDGSCLRNPGGAIGWAWVIDGDNWGTGGEPRGTNQRAELMGVLQALTDIPKDVPLLVQVDSQYALNVASKWMYSWKAKGWKRPNGEAIINLDLVQAIDKAMSARKALTQFEWVPGHSGHALNEKADVLAATAARHAQIGNSASSGPGYTRPQRKPLFPSN